jgi:RNA polymerase sigma-70 factor (ECF subfamily)
MGKQITITETQLTHIVTKFVNENVNDDLDLVEKIKTGGQRITSELYNKYNNRLRNQLKKYSSELDDHEINTIINNTIFKTVKYINQYSGSGSFIGWILTILRRNFVDFIEKKNKKIKLISTDILLDEPTIDTTRENTGKELLKHLNDFASNLPKKQFESIKYYLQGYTHQEIGKLMGTSEGTSKWQVSTGITKFKRWLLTNNMI